MKSETKMHRISDIRYEIEVQMISINDIIDLTQSQKTPWEMKDAHGL